MFMHIFICYYQINGRCADKSPVGQKPRRAEAPRFWQLGRKPRDFKNKFNYLLFLLAPIFFNLLVSIMIIIKRRHYRNVEFALQIAIIE